MSDPQLGSEAIPDLTPSPSAEPVIPAVAVGPERREWATRVISEILERLGLVARIESKDAADGGIAVAMHLEEALPGVAPGRRSHFVDSLQFLVNKIVNRPSTERRWVSIGVGEFPEPRMPRERAAPRRPAAVASASVSSAAPVPRTPATERQVRTAVAPQPASTQSEERLAQVADDAALTEAIRQMAERSSSLGRFYAIVPMSMENRARALRAAAGIPGVKVDVEGEGRNRRVVFTPDKPAPMPKKVVPDYGDDDEDL